ncbi:MAG: DJ-1/PfpI family protein [Candidatus Omnitrophica bacterium]|nr:DJ-1/PfpI family protein [Candidatus Omnitrophota bacterium]
MLPNKEVIMRTIRMIVFCLSFLILETVCLSVFADIADLAGKKVVMIIAPQNFRDEEFSIPKLMLQSRGAEIIVASTSLKTATGMLGLRVKPDITVGDITVAEYDAVIFVGGSGAALYWDNPLAHTIAQEALRQNRLLCAICIAPVTLAKAGVLEGKKATVWKSEASRLKEHGVLYAVEPVVRSGRCITANGPESAALFGQAIVDALQEEQHLNE